jgi:hypothetical protein
MDTIGWVLILVSVLVVRAVAKGRALNIPEDLGDAFQAFVDGRSDDLAEVFNRTGDTNTAVQSDPNATVPVTGIVLSGVQKIINQNIVYWMYKYGKAAKGYKFGAAGPSYYDCSGLVYKSVQNVGYTGPRFFTATVTAMPGFKKVPDKAQVSTGDIVLWVGHHMGVMVGDDRFYSALNPKAGIAERNVTGFRKDQSPVYLRFTQGAEINASGK